MLKPGAAFGQLGASDEEVYKESEAYDRVMYKRAFGWVKASENLRSDNAWTWSGWFKVKLMVSIMHLLGYGATVLEILHLRRRVQIAF